MCVYILLPVVKLEYWLVLFVLFTGTKTTAAAVSQQWPQKKKQKTKMSFTTKKYAQEGWESSLTPQLQTQG